MILDLALSLKGGLFQGLEAVGTHPIVGRAVKGFDSDWLERFSLSSS